MAPFLTRKMPPGGVKMAATPTDRDMPGRRASHESEALLPVGKITKAHGIEGEIKVYPYSGDPTTFPHYQAVMLVASDGQRLGIHRVTGGRLQGRHAILRLAGIDSREQAESLAGCEVLIDKDLLPALAEDEFYLQEMEGRLVVTTDGRELGRVSSFLATGAHDILVVTGRGREYLIPATREILKGTDEKTGTIVIEPLPGLLEMND
jgi:16S rRNA processing protein RimM